MTTIKSDILEMLVAFQEHYKKELKLDLDIFNNYIEFYLTFKGLELFIKDTNGKKNKYKKIEYINLSPHSCYADVMAEDHLYIERKLEINTELFIENLNKN